MRRSRASNRSFGSTARRVHPINRAVFMRGGIRL